MTLLTLNTNPSTSVSKAANTLDKSYNKLQSTFRHLELKDFIEKIEPETYRTLDPIFQK